MPGRAATGRPAAAGGLMLALSIVVAIGPAVARGQEDGERRLLDAINEARLERGTLPLESSTSMADGARRHSRRMMENGRVEHADPADIEGTGCVAEVVAVTAEERAFEDVMESPDHRRILLGSCYRRVGAGLASEGTGSVWITIRLAQG